MTAAEFPLLAELTEEERRQLLEAGQRRTFGRLEVVFHEGDPGDSLHLIVSGRLAVRVVTPLGDVATLSIMGRGQAFGELALLDPHARRSATVVALEPSRTLVLRGQDLLRLRAQTAGIDRFLSATMAGYVRRLSAMVVEAMYLPVEERVRHRLSSLAAVYGGDDAAQVEIRLTQDEIASVAGTTRATVNRVLKYLEADGTVRLSRGRVVILDRRRLDAG